MFKTGQKYFAQWIKQNHKLNLQVVLFLYVFVNEFVIILNIDTPGNLWYIDKVK